MKNTKNCGDASCGTPKKKHNHVFNANFLFIAITTMVTYSFYMVCAVAFFA